MLDWNDLNLNATVLEFSYVWPGPDELELFLPFWMMFRCDKSELFYSQTLEIIDYYRYFTVDNLFWDGIIVTLSIQKMISDPYR